MRPPRWLGPTVLLLWALVLLLLLSSPEAKW